jgi:hypothetical protein
MANWRSKNLLKRQTRSHAESFKVFACLWCFTWTCLLFLRILGNDVTWICVLQLTATTFWCEGQNSARQETCVHRFGFDVLASGTATLVWMERWEPCELRLAWPTWGIGPWMIARYGKNSYLVPFNQILWCQFILDHFYPTHTAFFNFPKAWNSVRAVDAVKCTWSGSNRKCKVYAPFAQMIQMGEGKFK